VGQHFRGVNIFVGSKVLGLSKMLRGQKKLKENFWVKIFGGSKFYGGQQMFTPPPPLQKWGEKFLLVSMGGRAEGQARARTPIGASGNLLRGLESKLILGVNDSIEMEEESVFQEAQEKSPPDQMTNVLNMINRLSFQVEQLEKISRKKTENL
jgi:hypothetical protein